MRVMDCASLIAKLTLILKNEGKFVVVLKCMVLLLIKGGERLQLYVIVSQSQGGLEMSLTVVVH